MLQEAALTRLHYHRCGHDSIQWSAVELRGNRIWNSEKTLRYPLVSEDLWNKHLGGKRDARVKMDDSVRFKPSGDEASVRLAKQHALKFDNAELLNKVLDSAIARTSDTCKALQGKFVAEKK
jgi:hypothetical protein